MILVLLVILRAVLDQGIDATGLYFQHLGYMGASSDFAHLSTSFSFNRLEEKARYVRRTIQTSCNNLRSYNFTRIDPTFGHACQEAVGNVDKSMDQVNFLKTVLTKKVRAKRQLLGLGVIASLSLSVYQEYEILDLKAQIHDVNGKFAVVAETIKEDELKINQLALGLEKIVRKFLLTYNEALCISWSCHWRTLLVLHGHLLVVGY